MISRAIVSMMLLGAALGLAGGVVRALDARDAGFTLQVDPVAGWARLAGLADPEGPPEVAWRGLPSGSRAVLLVLEDADGPADRPLWLAVVPSDEDPSSGGTMRVGVPFRAPGWRALWQGRYLLSARALAEMPSAGASAEELLVMARSGSGPSACWQAGGGWMRRPR